MGQVQIGLHRALCTDRKFWQERSQFWVTGPSWDLSEEVSPLGAGGWPKAEIHHPPPLPWVGRGCDHRHRARTNPMHTGFAVSKVLNGDFGVINQCHCHIEIKGHCITRLWVTPRHDCQRVILLILFLWDPPLSQACGAPQLSRVTLVGALLLLVPIVGYSLILFFGDIA